MAEEWCGWGVWSELGAEVLHVGPVPDRKQIALYAMRPLPAAAAGSKAGVTEIRILAYFVSEAAAREALAMIEHLAKAKSALVLVR